MTWPAHQFHPGQMFQFDDPFPRPISYRAPAVNFNGTDTYLTRGAGLTGAADSKLVTGSFWVKHAVDDVEERYIAGATTVGGATIAGFRPFRFNTNNSLVVFGANAANTAILNIQSSVDSMAAGVWRHGMYSVDMADTAKRHLYINDVSDLDSVTTYTDDTLDFTLADWAIGARVNAANKLNGDMADFLLWPGVYVDLSVEANRRLFISAAGKPVRPQVAEDALGTPLVALYGPTASWHTNKGSGGGFTENGALADAATSPSD